jgi:hypothetical protein
LHNMLKYGRTYVRFVWSPGDSGLPPSVCFIGRWTRASSNTILLCRVLAEQPRRSRLVTALAIYLDEGGQGDNKCNPQEQEPSSSLSHYFWTSISCALRNTTSLRLLRVYLNGGIPTSYARTLDGCSFQLHTFHCDLAWDVHLISFLITQRELTDRRSAHFRLRRGRPRERIYQHAFAKTSTGTHPPSPLYP